MSGFGALSRQTIEMISKAMDECAFHVSPDLSKWGGNTMIQLEVFEVQKGEGATRFHGWLLDPCLPQNMFSLDKRKCQRESTMPSRVCKCIVNMPFKSLLHVRAGDRIAAQVHLCCFDQERWAKVVDEQSLWIVSHFDLAQPVKFVHLFSGGFHGWAQAIKYITEKCKLVQCEPSVSVDWDGNVCSTASRTHNTLLVLPPGKELRAEIQKDIQIACDVKNPIWLNAIQKVSTLVWTISFPCPPYSRAKGKGPGLDADDGKPIIHVFAHARKSQPCLLLMENVDCFYDHPHARLVFALARWAGYRVVWMQKHNLVDLTDAARNRWLAALIRSDIRDDLFEHVFKPEVSNTSVVPWPNSQNQFALPKSLTDQLELDHRLAEIYGDPSLLPRGKLGKEVSSQADVLHARLSDKQSPLGTLVACYSKQHLLPEASLQSKGLFAELALCDDKFCFHSPAMWSVLLGNLYSILFPCQLHNIYEQLGNAIAVPHAIMACLAGLKAIGIIGDQVPIDQIVLESWRDRLDATKAVCVQTSEGYAIFTPGDFLLSCPVDRFRMLAPSELEGQCVVTWPDQVQSTVNFQVGALLKELLFALGFPDHVVHLWGFFNPSSNKTILSFLPLENKYEEGQFVFLPMMPPTGEISITEISSTMEWTQVHDTLVTPEPGALPTTWDFSHDMCTIILPDARTLNLPCNNELTLAQVPDLREFASHDQLQFLIHSTHGVVDWEVAIKSCAGSTLILTKKNTSQCVLEITMLDGATKFAPIDPQTTIREALLDLQFHPAFVEKLRAIHNGLLVPMEQRACELGYLHVRLVAYPLQGGGKAGPPKGLGKGSGNNAVDSLTINDPWKQQPSSSACRWDQLKLTAEHPVFDKTKDERIAQIPFLQVGPQKGGVAFATRASIPLIAGLSPPTPTVILIPGFRGLQGVEIPTNVKMLPPQQLIVEEPQTNTRYKRLVIPLVVCGDIVFKLQETGAIAVSSTKFAELVVEAHPNLLSAANSKAFLDHPLECFKKLIAAAGVSLHEISIYSYRKLHGNDAPLHQAIMKIPADKMTELLQYSGKHEVFVRQFLQPNEVSDHSVLPRYWDISTEEVRQAFQLGVSLGDSFRGLALTPKGVSIRSSNDALGPARQLVLQGDVRFNDTNRHVICKYTYMAQGYPFEVSHDCIIEATFKACQQACIPLRSFRVGGLHVGPWFWSASEAAHFLGEVGRPDS